MQGSQVGALLESLENLIGQNNRLVEFLPTMHHTMTDSIDFVKTLDNANLRISKQRENELHALGMLGDVMHNLLFLTISQFDFHESAIKTYTLGAATSHHTLVVHIVQGVLDRRRTTVQYKDFHCFTFLLFYLFTFTSLRP